MRFRIGFASAAAMLAFGAAASLAQPPSGVVRTQMSSYAPVPAGTQALSDSVGRIGKITAPKVTKRTSGLPGSAASQSQFTAQAYGTSNVPFSATSVQDGWGVANSGVGRMSASYPYRTVGLLSFVASAGIFYCNATLINRSVIITSAKCVRPFGTSTSNTGFTFRPSYYGGGGSLSEREPYGAWTVLASVVPEGWTAGTDPRSGNIYANDLALLVVAKNSSGQFVGDRVGWLNYGWNNYSYTTSNFSTFEMAATTVLGYAEGLDGGKILQRNDSPSFASSISGVLATAVGSNITTAGSPIIVNFSTVTPVRTLGQTGGSNSTMSLVGVLSAGDFTSAKLYGSRLGTNTQYPGTYSTYGTGNIGALMQSICEMAAPGGGTFKSQGYCN